jgi:hypothetical protein
MNGEGARQGASDDLLSRRSESNRPTGRSATWQQVDSILEVRSRLVVALDFIEDGEVRLAELAVMELLHDLDGADLLTAKAA